METAIALAGAWFKRYVVGWLARNWTKLVGALGLLAFGFGVVFIGMATLVDGDEETAEAATVCTSLGYEVDQAAYQPPPVDQAPSIPAGGKVPGFGPDDAEQIKVAQAIIAAGKAAKVGKRGMVVAIATALQESGLRNLDYGDRDSLGPFQQRPSQGWGTPEQVRKLSFSARAFFGGPNSPHYNKKSKKASPGGLIEVGGWEELPITVAAQRVQRSAFPDAYAKHEERARLIVDSLASGTPAEPVDQAPELAGDTALVTAADYRTAGVDIDAFCESNFELASASVGGGGMSLPEQSIPSGKWTAPLQAAITSVYGNRFHPVYHEQRLHAGTDFHAEVGTPIVAPTAGVVEEVTWTSGGGLVVQVAHGGGISTRHLHLSKALVKPGQKVKGGQRIALSGDSGVGTGAHYHFEVHVNGTPVDPETFMTKHDVDLRAWS